MNGTYQDKKEKFCVQNAFVEEMELFPNTRRVCKCGCGRPVTGRRIFLDHMHRARYWRDREDERRAKHRRDMESQFLYFHREHPEVYAQLVRLALDLKERGRRRYGIKGLWEVLRWKHSIGGNGEYRLNNNFTAFYARLIMKNESELDGFFETRRT